MPNRLSDKPVKLTVVLPQGTKDVYMRKHYNPDQPHISEDFVKLTEAFTGLRRGKKHGAWQCGLHFV